MNIVQLEKSENNEFHKFENLKIMSTVEKNPSMSSFLCILVSFVAQYWIHQIMERRDVKNVPILILANKRDLPNALPMYVNVQ